MFHSRRLNNRINKIHVNHSILREPLGKDDSITIHFRILHSLGIEFYKVRNDSAPRIMKEIFVQKEPTYILRCDLSLFIKRKIRIRTRNYCPNQC